MVVDENNKDVSVLNNTKLLLIKVVVHKNGLTLTYKEKHPITVQKPCSLKEPVICKFVCFASIKRLNSIDRIYNRKTIKT